MTIVANKGTPLSMPEAQAEPEINVVTYDEDPAALAPIEAVPVPSEDISPTHLHQLSPLVPDPANSSAAGPAASLTTVDHQSDYHHHHQQQQQEYNDNGFECVCCGDTRIRRISPGFNVFISLCGDTHIDIRDSNFPSGSKLTLLNIRLCGNTNLCVPPGTRVVVRRLLLCGNRDIYVEPDPSAIEAGTASSVTGATPRITLTILSFCGDVCVRSSPSEMPNKFFRPT